MAKSKKPRASTDDPSYRLAVARRLREDTLNRKHRLRLANILDPQSNDPKELILKNRRRGAPPKMRLTMAAELLHGISDKKEVDAQNFTDRTGKSRSTYYYHLKKSKEKK
jgi:DNA-binding transcriptional ArsR family regulator